jgi:predicted nucleic acid-binding protein
VALPDLIIAATAARHGLILLTRNLSQLGRLDVPALDPFVELPADA